LQRDLRGAVRRDARGDGRAQRRRPVASAGIIGLGAVNVAALATMPVWT